MSHILEHMAFKGTKRRGPREIAREVEAVGGEINAYTSFDQTVYHITLSGGSSRTRSTSSPIRSRTRSSIPRSCRANSR